MIGWWLALAVVWAEPAPDGHAWLETTFEAQRDAAVWRATTPTERDALVRFGAELALYVADCEADRAALDAAGRSAGLAVSTRPGLPGWLVVTEADPHGTGMSVWRCGEATEVVVQAPHSRHDLKTDDIARHALDAGVRGIMWNLVHRYRALPDELPSDAVHPADVTRHATSGFHTLSLAWAASVPEGRVLQIHGFGGDRDGAAAILSSGDATRPPEAARAPTEAAGIAPVKVYGVDIRQLGATRNVLGRALLRAPRLRFLHVELDRPTRDALAADRARSASWIRALVEVPWDR